MNQNLKSVKKKKKNTRNVKDCNFQVDEKHTLL